MKRLEGKAWCQNCEEFVKPVKERNLQGLDHIIVGTGAGAILGSTADPTVGAFIGGMMGVAVSLPGTWIADKLSQNQLKWTYIAWLCVLVFGSIMLWAKTCPEYIVDSFYGPKCSGGWTGLEVN